MQNLSKEMCEQFKNARRDLGLTQSQLAEKIGCKQAALSMFESGRPTKLSEEFVKKAAEVLEIDLTERPAATVPLAAAFAPGVLGFCPDPECPSNLPYLVGDRLVYRPRLAAGKHCVHCGELLEKRCPACGAQLNEGACCAVCGTGYVTSALDENADLRRYVAERQAAIRALV